MFPPRSPRTALLVPALTALAGLSAQAQILVTPHAGMLVEGEECTYSARVDGKPRTPCRWSLQVEDGPEQDLGEGPTLTFRARRPEGVAGMCTLLARPIGDDRPAGIARVLVLSHSPFRIIRQAWGPDLLADRYSEEDKGFSRLEQGIPRSFFTMVPPLARKAEPAVASRDRDHRLDLPPLERLETLRRLIYSLGEERVRVDVTGETQVWIPCRTYDHILEILSAWPKGSEEAPESVFRRLWALPVKARSVSTHRLPFQHGGLEGVSVCTQGDPETAGRWLLADTKAGQVRMLSKEGKELAVWGLPGAPGAGTFQDGRVLLAKPGFVNWVCARAQGQPGWRHHMVATDHGNHAVYRLMEGGKAQTIGIPGQQGHRNGAGGQALFSQPRGCVQHVSGERVFVVDAGNGEIRVIDGANHVITLAGDHAAPREVRDGTGGEARFKDPAGLAWLRYGGAWKLLVADDACLRLVDPADRSVRTVVGVPGRPGNPEIGPTFRPLGEVSCLGRPFGLACDPNGERVYIADPLYGTVRVWDVLAGSLRTLAGTGTGDPLRPGLLVDGTGAKAQRYASLTGLAHLALTAESNLIGTAPGHLAGIGVPQLPRLAHPGMRIQAGAPSVPVGQDLLLECQVPLVTWPRLDPRTQRWEPGPWLARPFTCEIGTTYPGGRWERAAVEHKGVHGETLRFTARFDTPGDVEVGFLVVNDQGCSFLARHAVRVTPAPEPALAPLPAPMSVAGPGADATPSGAKRQRVEPAGAAENGQGSGQRRDDLPADAPAASQAGVGAGPDFVLAFPEAQEAADGPMEPES